jgi:hypothetical protein
MTSRKTWIKLGGALVLLAVALLYWFARRTPTDESEAEAAAEAVTETLVDQLDWLAGCWEHEEPGFRRDEQWMEPSGGTMIGMSRSVAGGRTVEHEYLRIEDRDGILAYIASPSGQVEATFLQAELTDSTVVFEAPEHDFPQRIVYQRMRGGSVLAWVEGDVDGVTRVVEFPMTPARCP